MANQLGKLIQSHTAPAHTFATGKLKKGQVLRIVDVEGQPWSSALVRAATAAAISVSRAGASESMPYVEDLELR